MGLLRRLGDRLQDHKTRLVSAGVIVATILLLLAIRHAGGLERLEMIAYDYMIVARADHGREFPRIATILITEDDLERYGWPLSDELLATAIERMRSAGARAIGIDVFRPTPIAPGSDHLGRAIGETPGLGWATRFREEGWEGVQAPAAAEAAGRTGFSDLVLDQDSVARRALLFVDDGKKSSVALGVKLGLGYLALEGVRPTNDDRGSMRLGSTSLRPIEFDWGGYAAIDPRGYQVQIEFRHDSVRSYSLLDLLDGRIPPDGLQGRIVLLGSATKTVKDQIVTPLAATSSDRSIPGVNVHAMIASQMTSHALDGLVPTRPLSGSAESLLIAVIAVAGGLLGYFVRTGTHLFFALVGGALILVGGGVLAFDHSIWLPIVPMVGGWLVLGIVVPAGIGQAERAQRRMMLRLFSAHVSGAIVSELWQRRAEFMKGSLPVPVRLSATVMFSDINDFTTTCEILEPESAVRWLNTYMDPITRIIGNRGGVIEKFAGDGITAMWGVPVERRREDERKADAVSAVRAALEMRREMESINKRLKALKLPEMRTAVGIYSGPLVSCGIGNIERQQYTTIGNTTNVAARLVTTGKVIMKEQDLEEACAIVIGEPTYNLLENKFEVRELGAHKLKGKEERVCCYWVLGERTERALDEQPAPTLEKISVQG
jgi:adenylate cyclase